MPNDITMPPFDRRSTDQPYSELVKAVAEIQQVQKAIQDEQKAIREDLAKNTSSTAELVDLFMTAKGAFRLLGWIGSAVKWVSGIAIAIGVLFAILKSGGDIRK